MFEPSTEVIRKGKASKPNEFGKVVKLQEAENQIVIGYEVYAHRPNDSDLLIAAIETHQALLERTPRLVAADASFYSAKNEAAAKAKGVKRVCIPNRSTKSRQRRREQKKRWFRNGQKWRTGCEGRIEPRGSRGSGLVDSKLLPEKFIEHFGARLRALTEREADLRSDDARFPLSLAEMSESATTTLAAWSASLALTCDFGSGCEPTFGRQTRTMATDTEPGRASPVARSQTCCDSDHRPSLYQTAAVLVMKKAPGRLSLGP